MINIVPVYPTAVKPVMMSRLDFSQCTVAKDDEHGAHVDYHESAITDGGFRPGKSRTPRGAYLSTHRGGHDDLSQRKLAVNEGHQKENKKEHGTSRQISRQSVRRAASASASHGKSSKSFPSRPPSQTARLLYGTHEMVDSWKRDSEMALTSSASGAASEAHPLFVEPSVLAPTCPLPSETDQYKLEYEFIKYPARASPRIGTSVSKDRPLTAEYRARTFGRSSVSGSYSIIPEGQLVTSSETHAVGSQSSPPGAQPPAAVSNRKPFDHVIVNAGEVRAVRPHTSGDMRSRHLPPTLHRPVVAPFDDKLAPTLNPSLRRVVAMSADGRAHSPVSLEPWEQGLSQEAQSSLMLPTSVYVPGERESVKIASKASMSARTKKRRKGKGKKNATADDEEEQEHVNASEHSSRQTAPEVAAVDNMRERLYISALRDSLRSVYAHEAGTIDVSALSSRMRSVDARFATSPSSHNQQNQQAAGNHNNNNRPPFRRMSSDASLLSAVSSTLEDMRVIGSASPRHDQLSPQAQTGNRPSSARSRPASARNASNHSDDYKAAVVQSVDVFVPKMQLPQQAARAPSAQRSSSSRKVSMDADSLDRSVAEDDDGSDLRSRSSSALASASFRDAELLRQLRLRDDHGRGAASSAHIPVDEYEFLLQGAFPATSTSASSSRPQSASSHGGGSRPQSASTKRVSIATDSNTNGDLEGEHAHIRLLSENVTAAQKKAIEDRLVANIARAALNDRDFVGKYVSVVKHEAAHSSSSSASATPVPHPPQERRPQSGARAARPSAMSSVLINRPFSASPANSSSSKEKCLVCNTPRNVVM